MRGPEGSFVPPSSFPSSPLLMSLVALAIDAMLPARCPRSAATSGAPHPNDVQFVVTALFLGLGFGQILYGPLSDHTGRKPAIYAGLAVFMAGCLVSIFAPTFEVMLAGRVLQGIGVAGPPHRDHGPHPRSVRRPPDGPPHVVRDGRVHPRARRRPGPRPGNPVAVGLARDIATFLAIAAAAFAWLALRQPETLPAARRRPFSLRAVGGAVREILGIRAAVGYTLATGFAFSPFVAYLSSAQQIFQEAYRTGRALPAVFRDARSLAIGGAALVNGRLVMKHGMRGSRTRRRDASPSSRSSRGAGAFAFDGLPPLWLFMSYLMAVFLCIGPIFGNLNALAMEPLGHIAGAWGRRWSHRSPP